jgi:tRNA A-37 threonylcarbamoyl transferase component Bud32
MKDVNGLTIERYKIIRELGRGGMAVVYRAIDTMLDRNVAVKMILSENTSREKSEKLLKRFNREAKTLANLSHPNIVKVLDYGDYEGTPYLVMEYIAGGALKSRMGKPIPYAEAAALLLPIARALHHAHQQKIVHRDVKPENILINDSDQLMLSDFGILKLVDLEESHGLTGTGKIVGTPAYMSPEQIRGREVDGRTDMYSLGIVFFEMITGRKPYNALTPIELSMQHLHDPIPKAKQFIRDLPAEVDQVIAKSIAKNPEDRYPNVGAFAQALEKLSGTTVRTSTAERRAIKAAEEKQRAEKAQAEKKTARSRLPLYGILGVLAVLAIAGFVFRENIPFLAGLGANTATVIPMPFTPTATKAAPTPSPTEAPTEAATPTPEPDTPTEAPVSRFVIRPENASQVGETSRMLNISVIKMDWIENGNWLIDAGSNVVSFIDAASSKATKVSLEGGIPIAITSTSDRIYVLLSGSIKVIDVEAQKVIQTISPITGGAMSIAASPDGKLLALGISNNKTQLINAEDGSVVRNLKSNYGGWSVTFSPDSQFVVSGTSQGILKWETETGIWRSMKGGQDKIVRSLAFSHDSRIIAGGGDGFLFFWDAENGELLNQVDHENFGEVNSLDFSPDDSLLVTGTDDNIVRIWSVGSASVLRQLTGHTGAISGVCFSPNGEKIASGANNEASIRIWGLP